MKRDEVKTLAQEMITLLHNDKGLTYKQCRPILSRAYGMCSKEIEKLKSSKIACALLRKGGE